ncbi:hypothetical protein A8C56_02895 [Niabella ginsenosidivorans]|uniref:Uncharacterized protein n=1 Tax=Niabella ginsenosidivorans TaxID=1176587 RepID=A0A1A9HXC7_9BACT|nr:hypothetical protein A8C56_02895 [Niabella ginsenosidivorans]
MTDPYIKVFSRNMLKGDVPEIFINDIANRTWNVKRMRFKSVFADTFKFSNTGHGKMQQLIQIGFLGMFFIHSNGFKGTLQSCSYSVKVFFKKGMKKG